jgi:PhoH-like ATPase
VQVELNHSDPTVLPAGFRLGDNDSRILSVARNLAADGEDVVLVSKDLPLRVKAASIGLAAQEYRAELPVDSGWTGMAELDLSLAKSSSCTNQAPWSTRPPATCPATPAW